MTLPDGCSAKGSQLQAVSGGPTSWETKSSTHHEHGDPALSFLDGGDADDEDWVVVLAVIDVIHPGNQLGRNVSLCSQPQDYAWLDTERREPLETVAG